MSKLVPVDIVFIIRFDKHPT